MTNDLAQAARAEAILLVVPAQATRPVAQALADAIAPGTPVIACAKGIEHGTRKFMTEVIAECAPKATPAILSGPSFAADVARGQPTAVTLAAHDEGLATALARALASRTFRLYQSSDVRGVEVGGAAKNVLAIAAGIVTGRGLGASASAALTTRGFAELVRFGRAHGAKPETMMGLSGLGDLILTCSSPQSRNFAFGINIGRGLAPKDVHGTDRPRRRRVHGAGAAGDGAGQKCRHADFDGGRRHAVRTAERGPGDRVAVDATVADGGLTFHKLTPCLWLA